jgi:hypothetical protein
MLRKQMTYLVLAALFLLVLDAGVLADSQQDKMECLPEQPSLISPESGDLDLQDRYGIPRKQVLLEIATRPIG